MESTKSFLAKSLRLINILLTVSLASSICYFCIYTNESETFGRKNHPKEISFHPPNGYPDVSQWYDLAPLNMTELYVCHNNETLIGSPKKCLDGWLYGNLRQDQRSGSTIFEVLSFIAVAEFTNRIPLITDPTLLNRIKVFEEEFPFLKKFLATQADYKRQCECFDSVIWHHGQCCVVDWDGIKRIVRSEDNTIRYVVYFSQGIRHFLNLGNDYIRNALNGTEDVIRRADSLFPTVGKISSKNLCVHIRRGDFTTVFGMKATDDMFTVEAIKYIRKKIKLDNVFLFHNDQEFAESLFPGDQQVKVAVFNESNPPNTEFEFSKKYCDVVLLTASGSTYGYFLGYLSRGQKVYFNAHLSCEYVYSIGHIAGNDYFPYHWKALQLDNETLTIHETTLDF